MAPNTRLRRKGSSESALGQNILFTWNLKKILNLTTNYSKTVRELTEFGKSLLLIWREHNNLDLQKGTKLEDIT